MNVLIPIAIAGLTMAVTNNLVHAHMLGLL